jgi:glycosidase
MAEFGTMRDFNRLLAGAPTRGHAPRMDIVANTPTTSRMVQTACRSPVRKYGDYYAFPRPPNNWTLYSRGALALISKAGQYAHLFSKEMDLNGTIPTSAAKSRLSLVAR